MNNWNWICVSIPASQNATDPPGAHTGTNAHSQGADPAFPYNIAYTAIAAVALIAIGVGLVFVSRIRGGKV